MSDSYDDYEAKMQLMEHIRETRHAKRGTVKDHLTVQMGREMTREEIIRMAREAGGTAVDHAIVLTYGEAQRFAALVAAAEREACAKLCEETTAAWTQHLYNEGCMDCAKAIRSRGKE